MEIFNSLPPGFRFSPTDVELLLYYLKRKVMGKRIKCNVISEIDLYKYSPWDLRDMSSLKSGDLKWYFFSPREKKYGNGSRTNRSTEMGHWKTSGRDRQVNYKGRVIGFIRTLIFHCGRPPKGERTNWVMHEYRLEDQHLSGSGIVQDTFVLCMVFQKSGPGPRNGAQYGAPFNENDWNDDMYVQDRESIPCTGFITSEASMGAQVNALPVSVCTPPPPESQPPSTCGTFLSGLSEPSLLQSNDAPPPVLEDQNKRMASLPVDVLLQSNENQWNEGSQVNTLPVSVCTPASQPPSTCGTVFSGLSEQSLLQPHDVLLQSNEKQWNEALLNGNDFFSGLEDLATWEGMDWDEQVLPFSPSGFCDVNEIGPNYSLNEWLEVDELDTVPTSPNNACGMLPGPSNSVNGYINMDDLST